MSDTRDYIKQYNVDRDILRLIFLYGCFTLSDFETKGIHSLVLDDPTWKNDILSKQKQLNDRLSAGQKAKAELDQKLMELDQIYQEKIDECQKQIDDLEQSHNKNIDGIRALKDLRYEKADAAYRMAASASRKKMDDGIADARAQETTGLDQENAAYQENFRTVKEDDKKEYFLGHKEKMDQIKQFYKDRIQSLREEFRNAVISPSEECNQAKRKADAESDAETRKENNRYAERLRELMWNQKSLGLQLEKEKRQLEQESGNVRMDWETDLKNILDDLIGVRKQFATTGGTRHTIARRSYQYTTYRLDHMGSNEVFNRQDQSGNKVWYFSSDLYNQNDDLLLKTFRRCQFTDKQAESYIRTFTEKPDRYGHIPVTDGIGKWVDYGLVINRNRKYDLSADIFPVNLDQRRKVVLALYDYLSFLSHTAPFNVPYYFAAQKCRLDLLITCGMASSQIPEMPVLYRHNYLYYTLDDEVLYFILQAVRERMQLKITFKKDRRNYREGDTKYSCRTADVIPVKVRHDASSGRQYLLCVNLSESSERADSIRLDRIMDVKPEAPLPSAKWN